MDKVHSTTRRSFLKAMPGAAVALALPTAALALPVLPATELPHDRVHRLARELSVALGEWEGFKKAIVTTDYVMFAEPDPTPDLQHWLDTARIDDVIDYHLIRLTDAMQRKAGGQFQGFLHRAMNVATVVQANAKGEGFWIKYGHGGK